MHLWRTLRQIAGAVLNRQREVASRFLSVYWADRAVKVLLASLIIINGGFLVAHLVAAYHGVEGPWSLAADGGYAEVFNYAQTALCVVLLVLIFGTTKQPVYLAFALIFLFVLLDDSVQIHERVGRYLVSVLDLPAMMGVRGQDIGELLAWALAAGPLLTCLAWGFWKSDLRATEAGLVLAVVFAALVLFGAGLDMLVYALPIDSIRSSLAFVEDGGEMFAIVAACAVTLLLYRHPRLAAEGRHGTSLESWH